MNVEVDSMRSIVVAVAVPGVVGEFKTVVVVPQWLVVRVYVLGEADEYAAVVVVVSQQLLVVRVDVLGESDEYVAVLAVVSPLLLVVRVDVSGTVGGSGTVVVSWYLLLV